MASSSAVPYGYTVTLWSSGAVLPHVHGPPDLAQIALFIVSAVTGYNLFGGLARRLGTHLDDPAVPDEWDTLCSPAYIRSQPCGRARVLLAMLIGMRCLLGADGWRHPSTRA